MGNLISLVGSLNVNTGQIAGDYIKGNPQMLLFGSASFSSSQYATAAAFQTALINATQLQRGSSGKLYPLPVIQGVTDKTVAAKEGTLGYGLIQKLLRSKPAYEFDLLAGSTLEQQLIKFDKKIIPVIILDDNNVFGGVKDASNNFSGANYLVSIEQKPYGDAQNVKTTKVTISIVDAHDFVENFAGVQAAISTTSIAGLNDVTLASISANTSNVYHISANVLSAIFGQSVNLASVFGATLASSSLWVAGTGTNYATTLAITSVALRSDGQGYDVTFDSTAFSGLSSGSNVIQLNLAAPSVLNAANVTGVEGVALLLSK